MREESERTWTAPQLARRLYISEHEAAVVLEKLSRRQLISGQQEHRYDPGATGSAVDDLANTYRTRLIAITQMIHNKPTRLNAFADAFRFRKDG